MKAILFILYYTSRSMYIKIPYCIINEVKGAYRFFAELSLAYPAVFIYPTTYKTNYFTN